MAIGTSGTGHQDPGSRIAVRRVVANVAHNPSLSGQALPEVCNFLLQKGKGFPTHTDLFHTRRRVVEGGFI
jgi:hypothetical protein